MKRWFLAILTVLVVTLACGRTDAAYLREIRQTETQTVEDIYASLTAAVPTPTPGTPTPECANTDLFGNCRATRTPRPTRTPVPAPTMPAVQGLVTVTRSDWAPYFEDVSDVPDYKGDTNQALAHLLRKGFEAPIVSGFYGERLIKVVLIGWVELEDLDLEQFEDLQVETVAIGWVELADLELEQFEVINLRLFQLVGKAGGEKHAFEHGEATHPHFWDGKRTVGTFPKGTEFVFLTALPHPEGGWKIPVVDGKVQIRLVDPVWVRSGDVSSN